jgi:hypothetical protein
MPGAFFSSDMNCGIPEADLPVPTQLIGYRSDFLPPVCGFHGTIPAREATRKGCWCGFLRLFDPAVSTTFYKKRLCKNGTR